MFGFVHPHVSQEEGARQSGEWRGQGDQNEGGGPDQKRGAVKDEASASTNDVAAVTDDEDAYRMEEEALYAPPEEGELEGWGGGSVAVIAKDDDATGEVGLPIEPSMSGMRCPSSPLAGLVSF